MRRAEAFIIDLFEIPTDFLHRDDTLEELRLALLPYDNYQWDEAKQLLEPIARVGNLKAIFKYANTLDNLGETEAAVHFWKIGLQADDTDSCNNLANYYKSVGNDAEAKRLYEMAAAVEQPDALFNLGLLLEDENPELANEYFQRALVAGHGQVCAKLANEAREIGNIDLLLKYGKLGIERGDFLSPLAIALYYSSNENWEETFRYINIAMTIKGSDKHPRFVSAVSLLSVAYLNLGDLEASLETAERAVSLGSEESQDLVDLLSSQLRNCSNCHKPYARDDKFCSQCGGSVS